jgi:hypothetical protein
VTVRNPAFPGPPGVSFRKTATYPAEIMQKFRGLRWMPLVPELLDYENTQLLLIGEGLGTIGKAAEGEQDGDRKDGAKEMPIEEIERLEDEVSIPGVFFLSNFCVLTRNCRRIKSE